MTDNKIPYCHKCKSYFDPYTIDNRDSCDGLPDDWPAKCKGLVCHNKDNCSHPYFIIYDGKQVYNYVGGEWVKSELPTMTIKNRKGKLIGGTPIQ